MNAKPFIAKTLALAGVLAASVFAVPAFAGECPADQVGRNALADRMTEPKDVTDDVLGTIDLANEPVAIDGRLFRIRRLQIQPGGVVPFHSHEDRPAQIYVVSGEVTEYSSDCLVGIVHKAGDVSTETHAVSHWWRNTGTEPVVLISADLLRHDGDDTMM